MTKALVQFIRPAAMRTMFAVLSISSVAVLAARYATLPFQHPCFHSPAQSRSGYLCARRNHEKPFLVAASDRPLSPTFNLYRSKRTRSNGCFAMLRFIHISQWNGT